MPSPVEYPSQPPTVSPPNAPHYGNGGSGSSLPRPPAPPPRDNTMQVWLTAAGFGVMAILLVAVVMGLVRDNQTVEVVGAPAADSRVPDLAAPDPAPADPGPTDAAPSDSAPPAADSPDPDPEPANAEFDAVVDEIIRFVERERGLTFKERPTVLALDETAFLDRYNTLIEEDAAEYAVDYENYSGIYHALGLLRPGVTLLEAQQALGSGGVLGYYNPETKELVVRGAETTPLVRVTIAHELTHALDDQWFDLDRPEYDDAQDEIGFGFRALVEGNARRVDAAYEAGLSDAETADLRAEELTLGGGLDLSVVTFEYLELQLAPYENGNALVDDLLRDGQQALDDALVDPFTTSEQVLESDKRTEPRLDVPAPLADGAITEQGVMGQLVIDIMLAAEGQSAGQATQASQGWGGDWFVAWNEGDRTCVRIDMVGDTDTDTDELERAFTDWSRARPDAGVERVDGRVRVTTCG